MGNQSRQRRSDSSAQANGLGTRSHEHFFALKGQWMCDEGLALAKAKAKAKSAGAFDAQSLVAANTLDYAITFAR